MVYTVTLNTALDRVLLVGSFRMGRRMVAERCVTSMGGKGCNVSMLLKRMGCPSEARGFAAGIPGLQVRMMLEQLGIAHGFTECLGETRVNTVVVDRELGKQSTIIAETMSVTPDLVDGFLAQVAEAAGPDQTWCLGGSVPQGAASDTQARLVSVLKAAGSRVILDTSGEAMRLALKERPLVAKPNLPEMEEVLGRSLPSLDHAREAAEELLADGPEWVVASLGDRGLLAVTDGKCLFFPPLPIEVVSTAGAGDAVVAGMTLALERGIPFEEGLRLGAACAASAVAHPGTDQLDPEQVEKLFRLQEVRELE
ncbi:MAG TPA: 1-phosphofructokinase family hexose kinase [Armatimonadota bacterium]